jgi:S-formylglutathione hydrolase FrmB
MLHDEIPRWCAERGFDTSRMAAYGWSMGGHGSLAAAERSPGWLQAVSALSPAVAPGDAVFSAVDRLDGHRTALWCGTADALHDNVVALASEIPGGPAIADYSPGGHTRDYWNRVTPAAFAFVGTALS